MKMRMPGESVAFDTCTESTIFTSERIACGREEGHDGLHAGTFETATGPYLVVWDKDRTMSITYRGLAMKKLREIEEMMA